MSVLHIVSLFVFLFVGLFLGDYINRFLGRLVSWLSVALVLITVYDVLLRYLFKAGSLATQEMEWHLFALIFLLGAGYTFAENEHVRVDIFYARMSSKFKAGIDLFGTLFFLLPFCALVVWTSVPFVQRSFNLMERSADPGGLPYRFLIKAAIPLGVILLALQGLYVLRRCFNELFFSSVPEKSLRSKREEKTL